MSQKPVHPDPEPLAAAVGWRVAFVSVLMATAVMVVLLLIQPGMVQAVSDMVEPIRTPVMDLYEAYCPSQLQPLVEKGASVFLSPWLYLLMLLVFLAEKVLPARRQRVFSVGMLQDFFGWFVIGSVVRVVMLGVLVKGLYWFCETFLAGIRLEAVEAWPVVWVVILAVLVGDFLNWFHHYIRHKIQVFWLFHVIHHSQEEMNMFTDLRVHLVEYWIAKPISLLPLFVLGLNIELAFWLALILESYTRIYHANLRTNYGPLRYILVTPQSHRVHHSILPEHFDKNFAVIFCIWDRIFGTQWTNYDDYPPTGVDDDRFPHERSVSGLRIITNYLKQLAYPFIIIVKYGPRCKRPMDTEQAEE